MDDQPKETGVATEIGPAETTRASARTVRRKPPRAEGTSGSRTQKLLFMPRFCLPDRTLQGALAMAAAPHTLLSTMAPGTRVMRRGAREEERDMRLLNHACRSAARWPEPYRLSFTLNAASAPDGDFSRRLREILHESGLAAHRLDLEFQETGFSDDGDELIYTLAALRDLGVGTIMAGFGRGASSLTLLRDRALSGLLSGIKLDRSLFYPLNFGMAGRDVRDDIDATFIKAAIEAGRSFGLRIFAEGVEHPSIVTLLAAYGCCEVSGSCLAEAESAERMLARFRAH